jgi:hypothetical protein
MLQILDRLGARDLPVQYVATDVTLEIKMYRSLLQTCMDNGFNPAVESMFDGMLLSHESEPTAWVTLRQDEERLVMVNFAQANGDCVWVACTNRDWLHFIMLLFTPEA